MVVLAVPGRRAATCSGKLDRLPAEQRVRGTLKLVYGDTTKVAQKRIDEAVEELEGRAGMEWSGRAFIAALRSIAGSYIRSKSMWTRMGEITAPTLLVWGDQDRLVDVRLAAKTRDHIRGSRLIVLPGVGHVAMMEDPQTTARAVLALLEDAAATPLTGRDRASDPGPPEVLWEPDPVVVQGLRSFARRYGWRAYALPLLIVVTVFALVTAGEKKHPAAAATGPTHASQTPSAPPTAAGTQSLKADDPGASALSTGAGRRRPARRWAVHAVGQRHLHGDPGEWSGRRKRNRAQVLRSRPRTASPAST